MPQQGDAVCQRSQDAEVFCRLSSEVILHSSAPCPSSLLGDPGVPREKVPHGCPTLSPCFSSKKPEASCYVTAYPRTERDWEVVCECGQ